DSDSVNLDYEWITADLFTYSSGDSSQDVKGNIQIPLKGKNDSTLSWKSTSNLISINPVSGEVTVTRPVDSDTLVEIEVTVTKGNEVKTKKITILVKKTGDSSTTTTTTVDSSTTTTTESTTTTTTTTTTIILAANEYLISYVLDGGVNNSSNPSTYFSTGPRIVFFEPTKTDKVFGGWFTEGTFTNSITDIPAGSTGNKTVYAKWRNPIEPNQENQPGGEIKIPAVPPARAYWLAPSGMGSVGSIGAFVSGATMTTASEDGLTSIAAPVTPGTYYLYYVVRDTKEILSISANFLTVLGDNVPGYYKGKFYRGYMEDADGAGAGTDYKTTVVTTDFVANWSTVGSSLFSDATHYDNRNFVPKIMINKMNGDVWGVTVKKSTAIVSSWCTEIQFWKYSGSSWSNVLNYLDKSQHADVASTSPDASVMTSDGSTMFLSMGSWRNPSGSWDSSFQKRTGATFGTISAQINGFNPNNLQIGGNYLYTLSQKNEFDAADETEHTNMLSTHTGLTVQRYDMSTNFEIANFVKIGGDYFNVSGATKYYAFNPDMYIGSDGTPYVVFVEPTVYEHSNHNSAAYPANNWNDRFTTAKLTVMKYNGTNWVVVGTKLFSPEVYKTQASSSQTGTEFGGETEFNTKDTVYQPGICVGGGKVWVTATDTSDQAFICTFNGTSWSTVKTNYSTGVRYPDMVYDNNKLYITYTKSDGSGVGYYTYIP
ncbi:MAG TPA: InlB B-repeat-containing protein, partial [Spirochaetota bacterium]|nr:InlB B-repeat-containing protein [Spirochaetota bacterium]